MLDHDISHWTSEYFITYVFMCVADSDDGIDPDELKEIEDHVIDILGGNRKAYQSILTEVEELVQYHSKQDKETFIRDNKNRFLSSEKEKEKVIEGIEDIIIADLHVDPDEMDIYRFIKKSLRD
jgi:hypothetical protein